VISMSAGERAISQCEIQDVFLLEADCKVSSEFNPTQQWQSIAFQHKWRIEPKVLVQSRKPIDGKSEDIHILRYFVVGEARYLPESLAKSTVEDVTKQECIATFSLRFAADYKCPQSFLSDVDAIGAFAKNAAFHVWPYWREALSDWAGRCRLPRITLPIMPPKDLDQAMLSAPQELGAIDKR